MLSFVTYGYSSQDTRCSSGMPLSAKARSLVIAVSGGHAGLFAYLLMTGNESFYENVVMPVAQFIVPDGEKAHHLMVKLCRHNLLPKSTFSSPRLKTSVLGMTFDSPLGMAAGFDKDGECIPGLFGLGFDFVEVGSVTPLPQPGNPRPRVFRLSEDGAIINRYGFPSIGHLATLKNIRQTYAQKRGPLGVNLGSNKNSSDVVGDFVAGINVFREVADFYVINVSSPNTPGLRLHQHTDNLRRLLQAVLAERNKYMPRIPVLLKIAPDLSAEDRQSVAEICLEMRIDGLVISNTTIHRPETLINPSKTESGGLSGAPLRLAAQATLVDFYRLTKGRIPLIGVGGISSGQDAYERVRSGASLVQIYSAFTFHGPPIAGRIKRDLDGLLERDGFQNVSQAVGIDVK